MRRCPIFTALCVVLVLASSATAQWQEIQKIVPQDVGELDRFGLSIAADGVFAILGAPSDDEFGEDAGAVFLFEQLDTDWVPRGKLVPQSTGDFVQFGLSVAIDGDRMVIGSRDAQNQGWGYVFELEDGEWVERARVLNAHGRLAIDGDTFIAGTRVFERLFGFWIEVAQLEPNDGGQWDGFGSSNALKGDTILIGAPVMWGSSAVFIFKRIRGDWLSAGKLTMGSNNRGGESVAIGPGVYLVGVPGNPELEGQSLVRVYSAATNTVLQLLDGEGGTNRDSFGEAIDVEGEILVIGAPRDSQNGGYAGAAYVFTGSDGNWIQVARLVPDERDSFDRFGQTIALSGSAAWLGAPGDDGNGVSAGAVYLFMDSARCVADLNEDGEVNTQDFIAFLDAWANGAPIADWNDDGTINTQDFIAYLNDWATGCP